MTPIIDAFMRVSSPEPDSAKLMSFIKNSIRPRAVSLFGAEFAAAVPATAWDSLDDFFWNGNLEGMFDSIWTMLLGVDEVLSRTPVLANFNKTDLFETLKK